MASAVHCSLFTVTATAATAHHPVLSSSPPRHPIRSPPPSACRRSGRPSVSFTAPHPRCCPVLTHHSPMRVSLHFPSLFSLFSPQNSADDRMQRVTPLSLSFALQSLATPFFMLLRIIAPASPYPLPTAAPPVLVLLCSSPQPPGLPAQHWERPRKNRFLRPHSPLLIQ